MNVDARDLEILKAVYELGDPSPKRIEEETGIPKSTVHYRLNKLRERGIIRNDLYELDLEAIGFRVTVITEVLAEYEHGYHESGVSNVYFTMGDTDFIVVAHLPDSTFVRRLVEAYESIEGVVRTSSTLAIETIKEEQNPLITYDLETLVDLKLQ
jgi:DNA-binding Lrp family transcriptional regulator